MPIITFHHVSAAESEQLRSFEENRLNQNVSFKPRHLWHEADNIIPGSFIVLRVVQRHGLRHDT